MALILSLKKIILSIGSITAGIPGICSASCSTNAADCFPMPSFSAFFSQYGDWITGPFIMIFRAIWPFLLFLGIIIAIISFRRNYIIRLRDWMGWEAFERLLGLFFLYLLFLFVLYLGDKEKFWKWSLDSVFFLIIILFIVSIIHKLKYKKWQKIMREIISFAKQNKLDDIINKFIDDFRHSGKGLKSSWNYRGYSFDRYRLDDLQSILCDKGLEIPISKLIDLLIYYIDIREKSITIHGSK